MNNYKEMNVSQDYNDHCFQFPATLTADKITLIYDSINLIAMRLYQIEKQLTGVQPQLASSPELKSDSNISTPEDELERNFAKDTRIRQFLEMTLKYYESYVSESNCIKIQNLMNTNYVYTEKQCRLAFSIALNTLDSISDRLIKSRYQDAINKTEFK